MFEGRSTGELARLLGWLSLAAVGAGVALHALPFAFASSPLFPLAALAAPLAAVGSLLFLCSLLAAIGAFVCGAAGLLTGRDRGDAVVGILVASIPLFLTLVGVLFLYALANASWE